MWDERIPTFPLELESKAGYFVGHTYKVTLLTPPSHLSHIGPPSWERGSNDSISPSF